MKSRRETPETRPARHPRTCMRRGTMLIYAIAAISVLILFVSLAVDLGRVWVARDELQNAADSAARAACGDLPFGSQAAQNTAISVAGQNTADGSSVVLNPSTDIIFGTWDPNARTFTALSGSAQNNANAIRIIASRTASKGNAIPLWFARAAGKSSFDVTAKSTACLTGNPGAYSIIGLNGITMTGSAYTDSYNAATQGNYTAAGAHHKGAIASNGNITLSNQVLVDGDARCGVGMTTSLLNAAKVTGLNAPMGGVMSYPSVTLPSSYTDLGDVNMSSGSTSVGGGTYLLHSLILSGTAKITWTGPVVLYIRDSYNVSGSAAIVTYQNLPKNRVLNFLPTCKTATWTGTNDCVGELYAPDTDFTISGSVILCGRILAKTINNSSSGGMHYDESLSPPGGTAQREAVSTVQ
jgi:hypothetical protein